MATSRTGMQSEKNFRLVGRWARFAGISDPQFLDYIPQHMRGMALNGGPQLRLN